MSSKCFLEIMTMCPPPPKNLEYKEKELQDQIEK